MKNLCCILLLSFGMFGFAQTESYSVTQVPWSGDWMNQSLDQMVHGEDYLGYPGPLPKMFMAMGMDPDHPGVDFELLELVERDAVYWFGNCNGWASAAIQFESPDEMVINGIKLFRAETKALLSAVWKLHDLRRLDRNDGQGMLPDSFEQLLYRFIAEEQPLVFDITLGEESWNYPVYGFKRTTSDQGSWINVEVEVTYTLTLELADDANIEHQNWFGTYYYRINKDNPDIYEWLGSSIVDQPDRGWVPGSVYVPGLWDHRANRFFSMETFNELVTLAARPDNHRDLYEPNNVEQGAPMIAENLVMASLQDADTDWFQIETAAGEALNFEFAVYDGPGVDLVIYDADQTVVAQYENTVQADISLPTDGGVYHLALNRVDGSADTAFYKIQQGMDRSWFSSPVADLATRVINTTDAPVTATLDGVNTLEPAMAITADLGANEHVRAEGSVMWAEEGVFDNMAFKRYHREHPRFLRYNVPHLTFRNNWDTRVTLRATHPDEPIFLAVYDEEGALLVRPQLDHDTLNGARSLGDTMFPNTRNRAAWGRFETGRQNRLSGVVSYLHSGGLHAVYDLEGNPRYGDQAVYDLPATGMGWTGMSLLNLSGVENEVNWRLFAPTGSIIEEGRFMVQPNQRWLGTVESMAGVDVIEEGSHVRIFSQYELETFVIQRYYPRDQTVAYRMPNVILDQDQEYHVTVPQRPVDQTFVFTNLALQSNWTQVFGYSADGREQGSMRVGTGPIRGYQTRRLTLEELLADEGFADADAPITHFRVRAQYPFYMHELVSEPGGPAFWTRPVKMFIDP